MGMGTKLNNENQTNLPELFSSRQMKKQRMKKKLPLRRL